MFITWYFDRFNQYEEIKRGIIITKDCQKNTLLNRWGLRRSYVRKLCSNLQKNNNQMLLGYEKL